MALENADSIRFLYRHFIPKITEPSSFLYIDDTMVLKTGKKFENISMLYEYAGHYNSFLLNRHYFVSFISCILVCKNRKISYLLIPLDYKMCNKTKSKVLLAAEYVTFTHREGSTRHLFSSTISPACITFYYEQKTFWFLCNYMIHSVKSIKMMANLINRVYCSMKLLPYTDTKFEKCQTQSIQEFRFTISEQICEQITFTSFAETLRRSLNIKSAINLLNLAAIVLTKSCKVVKQLIKI